jgi:hypothetical protein
MKKHLPKLVYLLGLGPLAYWQSSLRAALGDWLSLLAIVCYLLVLRLIGQLAIQLIDLRKKREIERFNLLVETRKQDKQ